MFLEYLDIIGTIFIVFWALIFIIKRYNKSSSFCNNCLKSKVCNKSFVNKSDKRKKQIMIKLIPNK